MCSSDLPRGRSWVSALDTPSGKLECDLIAVAAIPAPASEGPRQQGCKVVLDPAAGGFRVDELFHDGAPIFALVVPATFVAAAFALTQRVAQVLWTPIAGRWSDRSANWAFVISTVVALTAVALLAVLRLDPVLFVVIGGCAFVNGLTTTIAVELVVSRRSRDHDRPRILAALHTWQDAGAAAGALLGGVLAAVGAAPALLVGAALLGLTLPLWWAAMRP